METVEKKLRKEYREGIPYADLVKGFVKCGFDHEKCDKHFNVESGTIRTKLRQEFGELLPSNDDGERLPNETNIAKRKAFVNVLKNKFGDEVAQKADESIGKVLENMSRGRGSVDKLAILAKLDFELE